MCKVTIPNNTLLKDSSFGAETIIQADQHIINIPIIRDVFVKTESKTSCFEYTHVIKYNFQEETTDFKILFRVIETRMKMVVQPLKSFKHSLLLTFKMWSKNNKESLAQDHHLFNFDSEKSNWTVELKMDDTKDLLEETNSLLCQFNISDGSFVTLYKAFPVQPLSTNQNVVANVQLASSPYLKNMYRKRKFTDITVKVNNELFPGHKALLGAASPVFDTMFDALESSSKSKKNILIINDMDIDIMDKMLQFVYDKQIEGLKPDDAIRLYSSAARFKILELQNFCSTYLSQNLAIHNIGEVIGIASLHKDAELNKKGREFFFANYIEVLDRFSWDRYKEKEPVIAIELLEEVCLQLKK